MCWWRDGLGVVDMVLWGVVDDGVFVCVCD